MKKLKKKKKKKEGDQVREVTKQSMRDGDVVKNRNGFGRTVLDEP